MRLDNASAPIIFETGGIKIYDVDGNEVALNVNGKYRINVVGHGSSMKIMGADALSNRITALQAKLNIPAINGLGASC
jgi:hypothetical protein